MKNIFDGYTINLILDEDEQYLAHFVEIPTVSAFGNTPEAALLELENAWNLIKEDYIASGDKIPVAPVHKQYSGTFNVRVGKQIHKALVMEAIKQGLSLNALVSQKLASQVKYAA